MADWTKVRHDKTPIESHTVEQATERCDDILREYHKRSKPSKIKQLQQWYINGGEYEEREYPQYRRAYEALLRKYMGDEASVAWLAAYRLGILEE